MKKQLFAVLLTIVSVADVRGEEPKETCPGLVEAKKPLITDIAADMNNLLTLSPVLEGGSSFWKTDLDLFFKALLYKAASWPEMTSYLASLGLVPELTSKGSRFFVEAVDFIQTLKLATRVRYAHEISAFAARIAPTELLTDKAHQTLSKIVSKMLQAPASFTPSQRAGLLLAKMTYDQTLLDPRDPGVVEKRIKDLASLSSFGSEVISGAFEIPNYALPLEPHAIHHMVILSFLARAKIYFGNQEMSQVVDLILAIDRPLAFATNIQNPIDLVDANELVSSVTDILLFIEENKEKFSPGLSEKLRGGLLNLLPAQVASQIPQLSGLTLIRPFRNRYN